MAEPPIYVSNLAIDRPGGALLQPQALPPSGGLGEIGSAVAGFATAAGGFVTAVRQAHDQTQAAVATGEYLTKLQELEIEHSKDPDFQGSPERFKAARRELELEASAKIGNPAVRQLTMLQWQRAGLSAQKHVTNAAFGREKDANQASILTHSEEALRSADAAGSPDERAAIVRGHVTYLGQQAKAGWISQEAGVRLGQQFITSLSRADAMRDQRVDPLGQPARMADPKNYPGLDPVTRESFKGQAANAHDVVIIDGLARQAQTDPAGAKAEYEKNKDTLQPHSQFRALQAMDAAERQAEVALDRAARAQASAAYTGDPLTELVKGSYDVSAVRVENLRNALTASAARGDETAANRLRDLDLALTLKPHVDRAWATPYGILENSINHLEAAMRTDGANVSATQVAQLKAFKAVRDEMKSKRETEPILLAQRASGRPLGPLDVHGPLDDANMKGELYDRGARAIDGARDHGGSANVLTAEEASQFKERFTAAGPNEKFNMLKTFAETLTGRAYKDTLAAVAGKDPMTEFVGELTLTRPSLAREIIAGNAILGGDTKTAEKSSLVRSALDRKLGGLVFTSDDHQTTVVSAALALDAARRASRGTLYDPNDTSGLDKALDDVAGPITKRNGAKFPMTPGIPPQRFLAALDSLTDADLAAQGGAKDNRGVEIKASFIRDSAVLRPLDIGGSKYAVMVVDGNAPGGFKAIFNSNGGPLTFDMAEVVASAEITRFSHLTPPKQREQMVRDQAKARLQMTRETVRLEDERKAKEQPQGVGSEPVMISAEAPPEE